MWEELCRTCVNPHNHKQESELYDAHQRLNVFHMRLHWLVNLIGNYNDRSNLWENRFVARSCSIQPEVVGFAFIVTIAKLQLPGGAGSNSRMINEKSVHLKFNHWCQNALSELPEGKKSSQSQFTSFILWVLEHLVAENTRTWIVSMTNISRLHS